MDKKEIKSKSLIKSTVEDKSLDLELINKYTRTPLTEQDVYLFDVILCDNDIDRVYDKMSDDFLNQLSDKSKTLTGLKDHDWESNNQLSRLYDTEVIEDGVNSLGETRRYVLGKAYTLSKYSDYIEKINAGLLKEVSVSFESVGDTCSICGEHTNKGAGDLATCKNNHIAGHEYDGKLCYNNLNTLTDTYEFSLVAVPCQRNAGIKNKSIGGSIMKKSKFTLQKLMSSKSFKEMDEELQKEVEGVAEEESDADLNEEDIQKLIVENTKLKDKIASLEEKLKEAENGRTRDKIAHVIEASIESLEPLTPTVAENIMRDLDVDSMEIDEGGAVKGLDESLNQIKEKYKGLIADKSEQKEPTEEEKAEQEKIAEEERLAEEEKVKSAKAMRVNSGISFGVNSNNKSVKPPVKSGLTIQ